MTNPNDLPSPVGDIETPHETVADSFSDGLVAEPVTVRLGDLWSDLIRVADERPDSDGPSQSPSALPLLDEMRGILQWD